MAETCEDFIVFTEVFFDSLSTRVGASLTVTKPALEDWMTASPTAIFNHEITQIVAVVSN